MSGACRAHRAAMAVFAAALFATVLGVAPDLERSGYAAFALPKELAAVAMVVAAALCALCAAARPLRIHGCDLALLGFVVLTFASSLQPGVNPWLAARCLTVTLAGAAGFVCARSLARRSPAGVGAVVCAVAVAAAAVAIAEAQGWIDGWSPRGTAPGGTFGNRNFLAHTLVLVVPLSCAVAIGARRRAVRAAASVGLALAAHAIALSHCRGAWLALGAALLASAGTAAVALRHARARRDRLARAALVAVALGGGVASAAWVPNQLGWREPDHFRASASALFDYRDGTGRGRVIQYASSLAMAAEQPFLGVGPGGWSIAYPRHAADGDPNYRPRSAFPVNRLPNGDWLGVASERGFPALAVLLAFFATLGRDAWRRRSAWELGLLAAIAVGGAVDATHGRPEHALVSFSLLGLGAAASRRAPVVVIPAARAHGAVAAAVMLALACHLGAGAARNLEAAAIVAGVEPGDRRRDVLAAFERAARLTPGNYRVRLALADHYRDCARALPHARAALRLNPASLAARHAVDRCAAR